MRIVFMGTPAFAATILERLLAQHEVVGVFTQPDAIRSRGKKLVPSPVKVVALEHDIPVYEYATFKDNNAFEELKELDPEVVCVAAYGVLLPGRVIDLPAYGCLNAHASLLPRWRGAAPIERAILAGDEEIGVCVMQMEAGLDTGDFCAVRSLPGDELNASEYTEALAQLGADALLTVLDGLEQGSVEWTAQDEALVTYAQKIEKNELNIDPSMTAEDALKFVRASSENHPSKCSIGGKDAAVVKAVLPEEGAPEQVANLQEGSVLFVAKKLYLGFADGALEILEVHPSGKKLMAGKDFAAGLQGVKQGSVTWSGHGE